MVDAEPLELTAEGLFGKLCGPDLQTTRGGHASLKVSPSRKESVSIHIELPPRRHLSQSARVVAPSPKTPAVRRVGSSSPHLALQARA